MHVRQPERDGLKTTVPFLLLMGGGGEGKAVTKEVGEKRNEVNTVVRRGGKPERRKKGFM